MDKFRIRRDDDGKTRLEVALRDHDLLNSVLLNKSTAFTAAERQQFGLEGLLPSQYNSMEQQARRITAHIRQQAQPLKQYVELAALQDRNEHLFFRVLCDHLEEFMPIVYTPTVGLATREFSNVFRRGRGIWITPEFEGRIADVLRAAAPYPDVRMIVVTDNESILGIGDQGAGGMAISVGKLALYTAGGGIHPAQTLPVSIDVGTDNQTLLDDELYLGWPHPRLRGVAYERLIEEFVNAVREVFPAALVQWEDFRKDNALRILERYRSDLLSFNDDIQGTGAVALAALLSAIRVSGRPLERQRILILGAGAAGLGIARQLRAACSDRGLSADEITRTIAVLDSRGLLADDRAIGDAYKRELAWPAAIAAEFGLADPDARGLQAVVDAWRPNVLIGTSGQHGAFGESVIRSVAAHSSHPVILPFSNPTDHSEAVPADVIAWTDGQALIATGSPFDDVSYKGKTIRVGQGNNVFIFPGVGIGALLAQASEVTDGMFTAAAEALAEAVTEEELAAGLLFPTIGRLREVSRLVGAAVMRRAAEDGVAQALSDEAILTRIEEAMWQPDYLEYIPV